MTIPRDFSSWHSYFSFALAREFVNREDSAHAPIPQGRLERAGRILAAFAMRPLDSLLREIRNPLVLLALTIFALAVASIAYYPVQTFQIATALLPFLKSITAEHVRAGTYFLAQTVILGLGLQALGRLLNPQLLTAYQQGEILAIPIGAVKR